jgi:PAS domain S-box-containing protein
MTTPPARELPAPARARIDDPHRLRVLRATGLLDTPSVPGLDRLTQLAARLVDAPVALVSLVDDCRQFFSSALGLPEPWAGRRETPFSHSFCQYVVAQDAPLVVKDARLDDRLRTNLAIPDLGVVAYAGFPLRSPDGHPLGSFCVIDTKPKEWTAAQLAIVEDLAAAAEAEIAVRLSHAELMLETQRTQAILDTATDAFISTDAAGRITAWNTAAQHLFGWNEAEALGRLAAELMPALCLAAVPAAGERLELIAVDRAGRQFPAEVALRAHIHEGHTSFHAFVHEITARRAREQALSESEAQLRQRAQLLDLTQDAVIVRGLDGRIRYWNPAAETVYGWTAAIATGHDLDRLLGTAWPDGLDRAAVLEILIRDGAWEGELEHRRADGRRVTVLSRKALQRDDHGNPVAVLSINTDVTARRTAEQALGASEQRFRSQFAHSAVGQIIRGLDDRIQEANPAFACMLGYSAGELVGTKVSDHVTAATQEVRKQAMASLFAAEQDSYSSEVEMIRADGGLVDVHVTVSMIRDAEGHPERFVGIFQDISDRKAAEQGRDAAIADLADRNGQLEAANQLKQDLIGMLGHEIGTPLASILGYSELITDGCNDLDAARQRSMLAAIDRNAHRLDGIVREVLAMVTLDAGELTANPEPVDVRAHLDAALAATDATDVAVECPAGLMASAQPGHLDQIVTNLLSNAAKYGRGATRIVAEQVADGVRISVEDAGPGVPMEFQKNLFNRFSRASGTAGTVKGTGLGLYITRELARANGGDVQYRPGAERGSIFVLTLSSAS